MSGKVRESVCVILIAAGSFEPRRLQGFLDLVATRDAPPTRCLVRVDSLEEARSLSGALSLGSDVDIQVLSHVDLSACSLPGATIVRMPPGSEAAEANELALALSDAVLITDKSPEPDLQRRARDAGKIKVELRGPLPELPVEEHVDDLMKLDPRKHPGGFYCLWGRGEALLVALLTFLPSIAQSLYAMGTVLLEKPQATPGLPTSTRWRQFRQAFGTLFIPVLRLFEAILGWRDFRPYLAPEGWRTLCPDDRLRNLDAQPAMMSWFDTFELAGGNGARCYRDLIWLAHLLAAAAVCSAVAGSLWADEKIWSWIEFALLAGIALIVWRGRSGLYYRWMACRLGAEELRASILCISLFATPGLLNKSYRTDAGKQASRYAAPTADAIAMRAVRDHGLSNLDQDFNWFRAKTWVLNIAEDQLGYHRRNHRRLEDLERAIKFFNFVLFALVILVVVWHLLGHEAGWSLFLTAGGPATVAALHSAATQLNIVHRSRASEGCASELGKAIDDFDQDMKDAETEAIKWKIIRRLAIRTADIMSKEVETWHAALARQPISLP